MEDIPLQLNESRFNFMYDIRRLENVLPKIVEPPLSTHNKKLE
jgi:hypothetical protein